MPNWGLGSFRTPRSVVIAYHGCDEVVGRKLVSGEIPRLDWSNNSYDWIGAGTYFFENDYDRAYHFAKTCSENPDRKLTQGTITTPFVVGAVINLGFCLDLSRLEGIVEARDAYLAMVDAFTISGAKIAKNEQSFDGDRDIIKRKLDRSIINYLHQIRKKYDGKEIDGEVQHLPPYDTVRCGFPQGGAIAETSAFTEHAHVQIAVRNANSIVGYFIPRAPLSLAQAFKSKG